MIVKIFIVLLITFLGMAGGQINKSFRRYLLPVLITGYKFFKKRNRYKALKFLLLIMAFSAGYGEHSKLRRFLKSDALTRVAIGLLISIPFLFFGKWYASIVLPIAYSIKAGGFKIGKYDWLWEDFIRYSTIGILVVI